MIRAVVLAAIVAATLSLVSPATVGSADAAAPPVYKNCTAFNKKYPHGLGRANARDKTSGEPVMTFRRGTSLYNVAMSYNRRLDRDKDGIACEKA
jgi:hypothetical protein